MTLPWNIRSHRYIQWDNLWNTFWRSVMPSAGNWPSVSHLTAMSPAELVEKCRPLFSLSSLGTEEACHPKVGEGWLLRRGEAWLQRIESDFVLAVPKIWKSFIITIWSLTLVIYLFLWDHLRKQNLDRGINLCACIAYPLWGACDSL